MCLVTLVLLCFQFYNAVVRDEVVFNVISKSNHQAKLLGQDAVPTFMVPTLWVAVGRRTRCCLDREKRENTEKVK
jgi:hypothetical protein